jgi:hypothetical protein
MTNEEKKRVFEYMGWCWHDWTEVLVDPQDGGKIYSEYLCFKCKRPFIDRKAEHPLDGNDIVSAINKMVEKGDLKDFLQFSWQHKTPDNRNTLFNYIHSVIGNPENFFQLMAKFLGG